MKKTGILLLALAFITGNVSAANAKTTVMGGPYTNLSAAGADIHFGLSNFPAASGLYIWQAVQGINGARPTIVNSAKTSQAWVSSEAGATSPNGDVKIRVTAQFDTTDCLKVICGIFVRLDHNKPSDLSEDQFFPITFDASAAPVSTLAPDTITASINGTALSSTAPGTLSYRTPVTILATTASGVVPTISSSTPDCSVKGNVVEALKVVAAGCDIVVESAGNSTVGPKSKHFPFMLTKGAQVLKQKAITVKQGMQKKLVLITNFGEKVSYSSTTKKVCTVKGANLVALKPGDCILAANAVGTNNYDALATNLSITVIKK